MYGPITGPSRRHPFIRTHTAAAAHRVESAALGASVNLQQVALEREVRARETKAEEVQCIGRL